MFSRRGKQIVLGLLALLVVVTAITWLRSSHQRRQALAQAKLTLNTADMSQRLQAASVILAHEPDHVEARFVRAREMFRRGNFAACREDLQALPEDELTPRQTLDAATLEARSLIAQARQVIQQAPTGGADTVGGQVAELLAQAASHRQVIQSTSDDAHLPQVLHAMELDTRAMYLRSLLTRLNLQINQTRTVAQNQEVEVLAVQTSDDQAELARLESQVTQICRQVLASDPLAPQPLALILKGHLRQGDLQAARQTLALLVQRQRIDVDVAMTVADEMLHLDQKYCLEVSPQDVAQVQALLTRISPEDRTGIDVQFMQAQIALLQGRYAQADQMLKEALSHKDYLGHAHGICLRARAMIGLGRHHEAEQMLARLNDRNPTWEGKYLQGLAMLADHRNGLDLLRQAQQMAPTSLPLGLAICQAIIANSGVAVAELDIAELASLAPMHSQVMDLRLQVAVWTGQRAIVNEYVDRVFKRKALPVVPEDVRLLALMTLDDAVAVESLGSQMLQSRPTDPLAMLARRWPSLPASSRFETARHLAQAMRDVVDDDPMRWPSPPSFAAWDRRTQAQAMALLGQADTQSMRRVLSGSDYLPWPYETALALTQAGCERWPDDAALPALAARLALWLGQTQLAHDYLQLIPPQGWGKLEHAIRQCLDRDMQSLEASLLGNDPQAGDTPTWQLLAMLRHLDRRDAVAATAVARQILQRHPRAEPVLLWIARELFDAPQELDTVVSQLRSIAPELVQITQARLMLARNQVDQVVRHLSLSGIDPLGDSSLRWQQVEVELQAARARNQPMLAIGMLETMALSIPSETPAIYIAEVDVMSQVSRERSAASIIEQQLASGLAARWLDLFLARSLELVEPGRMLQRVDALLAADARQPVLHDYRTRLLLKLDQQAQARQSLAALVELSPDSPRSLMLQARMAMEQSQLSQARKLLGKLSTMGHASRQAAGVYLNQMIAVDLAQPTTAGEAATRELSQ